MSFDRGKLPTPLDFYAAAGLTLHGRAKWRTARCEFHGGSDSMRINMESGGWCCMSCGAKGGDVLSYQMQLHGLDFIEAARQLGCWSEGAKPRHYQKPAPLPARAAIQVLAFEANVAAIAAGNIAQGVNLSDQDRFRLQVAARRINRIAEAYA